jgi:hypothetical protein
MSNSFFRNITFAFFLTANSVAYAQNKNVNNTSQLWSEVDLAGKINKKFKWQCDFQYSRQSPYESMNFAKYGIQEAVRPWIHYYPQKDLRISAFMGIWYNNLVGGNVNQREYPEYRTALQIQSYKPVGKGLYTMRFRTELREIEDQKQSMESVFRERLMFKYQRLLTHNTYNKNSLYLIAQDEVFVNDGSTVTGNKFFDQNRTFFGLGYNITNDISVETGYSNQFAYHAHDTNFDSNNALQVTLIIDNITGG